MKYCSIIYLCIICLYSCTNGYKHGNDRFESESYRIHLDFSDLSDTLRFSTFIDSVEEKTLVLPDSLYLGEASQVYIDAANIFVTDWRQNCIYRFDKEGKFINEINCWGEGPEEYLRINKIWVHNDALYIYDSKGLKINYYTLEGDFKGRITCKNHFSDIEMLSDSLFLCFTPTYIYENPTGVWLMDNQGEFRCLLFSYDNPYPSVSSLWQYFYRTETGYVGLFSPGTDSFFSFIDDSLKVSATIDCVQRTPASFPGLSSCWNVKEDFYNLPWFVNGDKWLLMCYSHFKGSEAYYALYSKAKKECGIYKILSVDVCSGQLLGGPVSSNLADCLVTIVANDYLSMVYDMMGEKMPEEDIDNSSLSYLKLKIYYFR